MNLSNNKTRFYNFKVYLIKYDEIDEKLKLQNCIIEGICQKEKTKIVKSKEV